MKTALALTLVLVLSFGCGDNGGSTPVDAAPDGNVVTPRAVVVSGTFMPGDPGVMSLLDMVTLTVEPRVAPVGAVGEDPVLRRFGDEYFIVNRAAGNNVTILDARFTVVAQLATGAGSNPQDVAVVGEKLFVPAFGTAGVVVLDRNTPNTMRTIDLSSLDVDGQPNCISAFAIDNDVYVACELLDPNFVARGPGQIVVINAATEQVRTMVTLANANPFGIFERMPEGLGGHLVIPTVPSFSDFATGCIEKITVGTVPTAAGCVVTNAALEGYASSVRFGELGGAAILWAVVSKFDSEARGNLQGFDVENNTLWPDPISPATQLLVDLAVCSNGKIVVADQALTANGLRVYEGVTETTTAPLGIGLKPNSARGLVCD